ncbi:MAG: protein-glutamate O-methyltransferase [Roseovarius sp.]|nr:protein-glutamate O-methyltransferase [Roseovarius sp.]
MTDAVPSKRVADRGMPALTDKDFTALSQIVHEYSGIHLTESKKGLVVSRLGKRLRKLELPDFTAYCRYLKGPGGSEERTRLISALTTNVTRFFREDHHFTALRESLLPPLLETARQGGRVRIWSAGCSTGEEPYSIAITLLELAPEAARCDIRILATDIDPEVVEVARSGVYPADAIGNLGKEQHHRYFEPVSDGARTGSVRVADGPRELITFGVLNLIGQWPFRGSFDIIFCRNVVIYFDAATQEVLWQRFSDLLAPGGHLFIGHSERLSRSAEAFFVNNGITQYRKRGKDEGALHDVGHRMHTKEIST